MPTDLPERLAPLVSWLEPLADTKLIRRGDHLCYCPDGELFLIPLHYLRFRGRPLVEYLTVSRVHTALALDVLRLPRPETPSRFVAVEVPAQQDRQVPGKSEAMGRVPRWLEGRLPGERHAGAGVDLGRVKGLILAGQVVHFATHGTFPREHVKSDRDPNPYTGSGLLLADGGELPDLGWVFAGAGNNTLLTPEKALAMDFSGSHVTLQACVSGLAKEGVGGDALGLEWALMLAGASSVLSTHWDVPAASSAHFGERFCYRWLGERLPRGVAWQETVLELMQQSAKPCDWAAFSLSGEWR